MIEMVLYTLAAIILYLVSDWILNQVEIRRGKRLEHRSLIFFAIILVLTMSSFSIIERLGESRAENQAKTEVEAAS